MDPLHDTRTGHPRRWVILGVLCAALCVIIIDETILYISVPALFSELGASNGQVQWAIDAYVILYAALLLPAGNLGDRFGRRTFLLIGLVIFGVGSIGATGAPNADVLIGARAVMAVGGALIMPQTLSILTEVFSDSERGLAIGVWSGVSGIGIVAGPIVGGLLLQHFWWGSVFLVNIPVVIAAIIGSVVLLPNHRDPDASPADLAGSVLIVVALVGLLGAVIEAPTRGFGSPLVIAGLGVGFVAGLCFIAVERAQRLAMLDFAVLRNPRAAISLTVIGVTFGALQGSSYALTQYLQLVQGRGAMASGMLFAPTTIAWSSSAVISSRVVRRYGMRAVLVVSMAVTAVSYLVLGLFNTVTPTWVIVGVFAVQGVTMGLSTTPLTDVMMGVVSKDRSGVASALNDMSRQIGGATGVAVFGAVLGAVFVSRMGRSGPENLGVAVSGGVENVIVKATEGFLSGFRWSMILASAMVAMLLPVVSRWSKRSDSGGDPGSA